MLLLSMMFNFYAPSVGFEAHIMLLKHTDKMTKLKLHSKYHSHFRMSWSSTFFLTFGIFFFHHWGFKCYFILFLLLSSTDFFCIYASVFVRLSIVHFTGASNLLSAFLSFAIQTNRGHTKKIYFFYLFL